MKCHHNSHDGRLHGDECAQCLREAAAKPLGLQGLTLRKTLDILAREEGWIVTGVVLSRPPERPFGETSCVIDQSAVRWLTREDWWTIMHPPQIPLPLSKPVQPDLLSECVTLLKDLMEADKRGELHRDPLDTDHYFQRAADLIQKAKTP